MNQPPESNPYSHPTSGGVPFLKLLLAGAALAGIGGVIWYKTR